MSITKLQYVEIRELLTCENGIIHLWEHNLQDSAYCGIYVIQVLHSEHKLSFHISTKMHLLEFSTFSRRPSTPFSYIVAFKDVIHGAGLK